MLYSCTHMTTVGVKELRCAVKNKKLTFCLIAFCQNLSRVDFQVKVPSTFRTLASVTSSHIVSVFIPLTLLCRNNNLDASVMLEATVLVKPVFGLQQTCRFRRMNNADCGPS